jgi:hypothetical protein
MKPENSCTITLTESELNLVVSGLVVFEREQLRLANLAQEEGSTLEAETRRLTASKIKQLADRIADTPLAPRSRVFPMR